MDEVIREMADGAGIPYNGAAAQAEIEPTVERNVTGDYLFTWETINGEYIRVKVADVGFVRGEMHTRLSISYKNHKGAKPRTLHSRKRWIPESTSSTSSQFTELNRWKVTVDWPAILTYVSTYFETNFETGDPLVWLDEVTDPGPLSYMMEPLAQINEHTLIGAKGGSMKSMTALAICLSLATKRGVIPGLTPRVEPVKCLYLDYETNAATHSRRLHSLARAKGIAIPKGMIAYKRLTSPLVHMKSELQQLIALQGIGFAVVDSVGRAVGGETVAESEVQAYYNATSAFNITMLSIGHTSKGNAETVAGNAQWEFQARSMWIFEAAKEHGSNTVIVGMHHRKVNEGELLPSLNFAVTFGNGAVSYSAADDIDLQDLRGIDLKAAVRVYLTQHPNSTAKQVGDALEKTEQRVGKILRDHAGKMWQSDGQRPAKWTLLNPVYKPGLEGRGLEPLQGSNLPHSLNGLEFTNSKAVWMPYKETDDDDLPNF